MKVFKVTPKNKLIIGIIFSTILILSSKVYAAKISIGGPSNFEVGQTKRFIVVDKTNQNGWSVEIENNNGVISAKKKNRATIECKGLQSGKARLVVKDDKTGEEAYLDITVTSKNNIISTSGSSTGKSTTTSRTKSNTSTTKSTTTSGTKGNTSTTKSTTTSGTKSNTSTTKSSTTSGTKSNTSTTKAEPKAKSVKISKKPTGKKAGETFQFQAVTSPKNYVGNAGTTVRWSSSDSSIISINSQTGQAELKKAGKATITVTYSDKDNSQLSAKTTVTVSKPKSDLKTTQKSNEEVMIGAGNQWTVKSKNGWRYEVSKEGIVSVTRNGDTLSYTAVKEGQTYVYVIEEETGKKKRTRINVLPKVTKIEITNKKQMFKKGRTYTLRAKTLPKNIVSKITSGKTEYGTIKWSSSDTSIGEIDAKTGRLKIKKDGEFKVTLTYNDGKNGKVTDTAKISIGTSSSSSVQQVNGNGYEEIVTVGSKKYKVYCQGNFSSNYGDIPSAGCSISSMAIVLTGYGKNVTPTDVANKEYAVTISLDDIASGLKSYGLQATAYSTYGAGQSVKNTAMTKIDANLKSGKPVIILVRARVDSKYTGGAHYMALLGYKNGKPIIADPAHGGKVWNEDSLSTLVNSYIYCGSEYEEGYVLINS